MREARGIDRQTLEDGIDAALGLEAVEGPFRGYARRASRETLGKLRCDQRFQESCRRALHQLIQGPHDQGVVGILSPQRGEGRSTVAAAMASSLQHSYGDPVALLDLDFEKQDLSTLFGVDPVPGLADYLEDRKPLRLVAGGAGRRLCLIPAGRAEGERAALYRGLVERNLLGTLGARFRWIVIDLPPLLVEPAGAWLAPMARWQVVVGRYRRTTLSDLEELADMVGIGEKAGFLLTGDTSRIPAAIRRLL